ncbi:DNA polymerase-3 subunit delta' [Streptococcus henryi]|uniref:DNA polymerase-3 subunit delta n=1 Tax=Streptococcus henryi TaxID=439219 RepID=A0A1G6CSU4_9STRE|nr:DNA polymerase III subunit delta' [Streptococcus henryi]SDB35943.1 DNA polymerase-3 subunit delta' [Streptococcus henryi]
MTALDQLQPKLFEEFKAVLQADRLNHAYLFSGDFASLDMALYLAQSRFCENLKDKLPCGNCRACHLIQNNEFSDVKLLEPSGQVIKTDTVKEMMRDFSSSGFEGKAQVFIIRDCEKMHVNAANSLLKFIEEPQSDSYMFLLTSDENKVLPTIKSRTQIFRFPKNLDYLTGVAEKAGFLKTNAQIYAQVAKDEKHLQELLLNKKVLELLQSCQIFIKALMTNQVQVYLEVARLSQIAVDKSEQELAFHFLTLLLNKESDAKSKVNYLKKLFEARRMWSSNVSFQNALEYMVIS